MSDLSRVFHSAFKNVFTECKGCKHYKEHINMIATESKAPCKYCRRHFFDKYEKEEDTREIIVVPKTCEDCIKNTHFWWVCDCPTSEGIVDDDGRKENCPINNLEIEVEEK